MILRPAQPVLYSHHAYHKLPYNNNSSSNKIVSFDQYSANIIVFAVSSPLIFFAFLTICGVVIYLFAQREPVVDFTNLRSKEFANVDENCNGVIVEKKVGKECTNELPFSGKLKSTNRKLESSNNGQMLSGLTLGARNSQREHLAMKWDKVPTVGEIREVQVTMSERVLKDQSKNKFKSEGLQLSSPMLKLKKHSNCVATV